MVTRSLLAALAAAAALGAPAAAAQRFERDWIVPHARVQHEGARITEIQARVLPLRALIAIVQAQRGGEFAGLEGDLQYAGGRAFYIFRWRHPSGMAERLRVDASNGQIF